MTTHNARERRRRRGFWQRTWRWLAPGLLLIAGVSLVAESYKSDVGWWVQWLLRFVGFALLLLVPGAILDSAADQTRRDTASGGHSDA